VTSAKFARVKYVMKHSPVCTIATDFCAGSGLSCV